MNKIKIPIQFAPSHAKLINAFINVATKDQANEHTWIIGIINTIEISIDKDICAKNGIFINALMKENIIDNEIIEAEKDNLNVFE
ncbi:hypothetical protein [Mycoplasmoides alvi]|uniref:hypothetical protein n=1 Tax=Mycoplasmoides alvi TaxID=78580 RepID=UPI00051C3ECA|nr:hypothetical protein [Mycoplasmoides alvi]